MKTLMIGSDKRGLLVSLLQNPIENRAEIVEIVASDSALKSFLLNVVNNPVFGVEENVIEVSKVFDLLGIGQVSELLLEELTFLVQYSAPIKANKGQIKINDQIGFDLQKVAMI